MFMTVKELSKYLNVPEYTIRGWVAMRSVPFLKMGKRVKFRKETIETWLKDSEVAPI